MTVNLARLALLRRKVPRVLWKYGGVGAVPIIGTLRLKVTRPSEFNDPFEFAAGAVGTVTPADVERFCDDPGWLAHWGLSPLPEEGAERAEQLRIGAEVLGNAAREIFEEELDRVSAKYAVVCLSGDPANILMWSHYADHHRGFAVGVAHRRLGDLPIFPVEYTDRRVLYRATTPLKAKPALRTFDVFTRKSPEWAYEREFRSIWPLTELLLGRIGNVDAHFLPLLPEAIVEVRLGVRASGALEEQLRHALRDVGSPAHLTRARMHPRSYKLEFGLA